MRVMLAVGSAVAGGWVTHALWPEVETTARRARRTWMTRCRWRLARHQPVRVLDSVRPLGAGAYAITREHRECRVCRTELTPPHDRIEQPTMERSA